MCRAHDTVLDRDVALAVIKTEDLDRTSSVRITREAQAVGGLGTTLTPFLSTTWAMKPVRPTWSCLLMRGGDDREPIRRR